MSISLITEYPLWFIIFCVFLGALYSFVLYRKEKKFEEVSAFIRWVMATARFFVAGLLAFFLLSPLMKTMQRELEKPVIIIATDNSESILFNKDSAYYKNQLKNDLQELSNSLNKDFSVQHYSFGDKVKNEFDFSFSEKQTDLSSLFSETETRYNNRNLGAVIIATDGLYNKGANPVYTSSSIQAPVYTIALGDTTIKKDVILKDVRHNSLAFLGNDFPVQVVTSANKLSGSKTMLSISKNGKTIFNQTIDITQNNFINEQIVKLTADLPGTQHYTISLSEVKGEHTINNNKRDIYINVLDARQKILIISTAAHPDIAALKQSIEQIQTYEATTVLANELNEPLKKYNLIIAHRLQQSNTKIFNELEQGNIPTLFIGGNIPESYTGVKISVSNNKTNDAEASLQESFNLFNISDDLKNYAKNFPALQCPFGNYSLANSAQAMINQRIGIVNTNNPLIVFNQKEDRKTAFITGEGIWKWRMHDYADNNNHTIFNELIHKTIQYLAVKADKSFFRVSGKNTFTENQDIEFNAEVYNQSYEPINNVEVNITITNSENKKYQFAFYQSGNAYHLNSGTFAAGNYSYEAQTKVGDKIHKQSGKFIISPVVIESTNTIANHNLLYNLSKKFGGEMIYPNQLNKLSEIILKRDDIKTISYTQKKLTDLIEFEWLFYLLISLLSIEWFLRKRNGAY